MFFWSHPQCFGPLGKFQHNIKISVKLVFPDYHFLWLWFGSSLLSNNTEKYIEIYFLKSHHCDGIYSTSKVYIWVYMCYKRLSGRRWVEYGITTLESHLHNNLPILIGFCDQQIKQPHNQTTKKLVPLLEGIRRNITSMKPLLFNSVKLDILNL